MPRIHSNGGGGAAAAAPVAGVPTLGTFNAAKSRYYADKVYDPVSGTHYDADSGEAEIGDVEPIETEEVNQFRSLTYNITFLVVLTVIGIALVRANPASYLLILGVSNFLAGMAMPIFRTVEFAEDYSADLPLALALILILGPFVGAILYAFICMAKQGDVTPGVVGVFISYLVLRIALDATVGIKFDTLFPWNDTSMQTISAQLMPIATILGWFAAFPFHRPDES